MKVCFIGHRTIEKSDKLISLIKDTVITLINNGYTTFLFGNKSAFDTLSLEVVTELKNTYPSIERIYVRSSYKTIEKSYEQYLLELYDKTYFPSKIENAGKYSYVERNFEMIDRSNYCVIYYDENYMPPRRKNSRRDVFDYQPKSGTKLAYNYAVKKGLEIINIL